MNTKGVVCWTKTPSSRTFKWVQFFFFSFSFYFFHWFSYLVLVLFVTIDTSFHSNLYPNPLVLTSPNDKKSNLYQNYQHRVWSPTKMKTYEWSNTVKGHSQLWSRKEAQSPKKPFWPNLAKADKECVWWVYDVYALSRQKALNHSIFILMRF